MIGRRTVGRALFFGLGYVLGTRAGRERYAQIQAGARAVMVGLRSRLDGGDGAGSPSGSPSSRPPRGAADPYDDIRLGG
ncbi:hypothetical protein [Isoptericola sp. NPDC057559]|jgi:hypothetical protein|uniref:hypothetical protein n=1 Tax=Isoptericola sp. NPDC057559 TaxID=3346168 RepID=UPI0036BC4D27